MVMGLFEEKIAPYFFVYSRIFKFNIFMSDHQKY